MNVFSNAYPRKSTTIFKLHLSIIEIFFLLVMYTLRSGNSGSSYEKMQLLGDVLKMVQSKSILKNLDYSHI